MNKLALALGFLSVFGLVAYAIVVLLIKYVSKEDKTKEKTETITLTKQTTTNDETN
jgi:hypothetical protein